MKIMVVDQSTGNWNEDYPKARLMEVSQTSDLHLLNITSIAIFNKSGGDTLDMLTRAADRINELYGESSLKTTTIYI